MITYAVTPLLADDNWGNLMAVLPKAHEAGGGIYYHADCTCSLLPSPHHPVTSTDEIDVGDPRSYKWINTVPLAKSGSPIPYANAHTISVGTIERRQGF